MNDWWKAALAGTAGVGLLALTGGAAAPGLLAAEGALGGAGTAGAVGAGAAEGGLLAGGTGAATTGAALADAGATAAAATGSAAAAGGATGAAGGGALGFGGSGIGGGMLSADAAGAGGSLLGAGGGGGATAAQTASFDALGGELSNPAIWQTATANAGDAAAGTQTGGILQAAPSATQYVTPPVTQQGLLGSTSSLDAIAASQPGYVANGAGLDAVAASQPGYAANGNALNGLKAGSMLNSAGKAASAYTTMNKAMTAGQQPQRQAPPGRPIFQGEAPQIAPQATAPQQGLLAQSGGNASAMLRALAQQRLGRRV